MSNDLLTQVVFFGSEAMTVRGRIQFAEITSNLSQSCVQICGESALVKYCEDILGATPSDETRRVEILLNGSVSLAAIRRVWNDLRGARRQSLALRIRLASSEVPSGGANSKRLVIDLDGHRLVDFQNKLEALSRHVPSNDAVLLAGEVPLVWPRYASVFWLSDDPQNLLFDALDEVKIARDSQVIFLRSSESQLHTKIARDFWKRLFAGELPDVLAFDDTHNLAPLRLFEESAIETLFVFPERMLPLQRAYFARGFDLLLGLNYGGEPTAALVFGPDNRDLERIQRALEIVCPRVVTHPLKRGGYPATHRLVRRSETFVRRMLGVHTMPPMRFSERCFVFGTERHTKLLEGAIEGLPALRNVVYTGAWFTPSIMPLKEKRPSVKWYCDTHDVFFVLDRDSNHSERRVLYSAKRQRSSEISLLNQTDGVIAISDADRASIVGAGCSSHVLTESGSFAHAARGVKMDKAPTELVFGFIGSNNTNNEKCLRIVRTSWWPAILEHYPNAKLKVAGGICKSKEAENLENEFSGAVQRLGFVDVLSEFYGSVQAMLSPIAVQGGLNFKSVEALVAGRPLLTNELGTRCIGNDVTGVCVIGPDAKEINEIVERIGHAEDAVRWRETIHQHALQRFGDDAAYRGLIARLKQ
ncbi:glycosyltransferase [Cupriavidus sp. P-10]|uniref:glycosyltransferase n=1 Tax=Cupriavidus sp. P-10 TaxID=2027911 RepID=UPI000E2F7EA7|nr:glycosyltransferase [Cupriavidus sp. P-10]BDB27099.1 glycosyltransferase [Cupriavidus sp. P-10]